MPDADDIQKAAARVAQAQQRVDAKQAELIALVNEACDQGLSEIAAAKAAGVTRSTIRRWRGKHTWRDQH